MDYEARKREMTDEAMKNTRTMEILERQLRELQKRNVEIFGQVKLLNEILRENKKEEVVS